MPDIVILADDLSGAADCGIVCAEAGLDTLVTFGQRDPEPDVAVLAIDGDTRSRSGAEAVAETHRLVQAHAPAGRLLFRKIDSTLRGHMGAELAATLAARRKQGRAVILLAPAFPATGRTTHGGHQHLHGVKLEHTELWRREGIAGPARIPEMLAGHGLRVATIGLADIRAGGLHRAIIVRTRDHDVVVFDAEVQSDLQAIGAAAASLGGEAIWAGSAGLARCLPQLATASGRRRDTARPLAALVRPLLFVVGSASAVSRAQAERLSTSSGIVTVGVPTSILRAGRHDPGWNRAANALGAALDAGHDVMVRLGPEEPVDLGDGLLLCRSLARLVAPFAARIGGLVSTGGETARAVLQAFGVEGLRLVRELEAGVPLSITDSRRPMPVITKAGGFGTIETLRHCRAVLHGATQPNEPEAGLP